MFCIRQNTFRWRERYKIWQGSCRHLGFEYISCEYLRKMSLHKSLLWDVNSSLTSSNFFVANHLELWNCYKLRSRRYNLNMLYWPIFKVKDVLMGIKSHFDEDDVFKSRCKGKGRTSLNDGYWYSLNVTSDYFYSYTPVRTSILVCLLGIEIQFPFKGKFLNNKIQK